MLNRYQYLGIEIQYTNQTNPVAIGTRNLELTTEVDNKYTRVYWGYRNAPPSNHYSIVDFRKTETSNCSISFLNKEACELAFCTIVNQTHYKNHVVFKITKGSIHIMATATDALIFEFHRGNYYINASSKSRIDGNKNWACNFF